jgi:hypothetical protein
MGHWLTRGLVVRLIVFVAVVVVVATLSITPPAHEIHTLGATALKTQVVESYNTTLYAARQTQPSQSLDAIRCELWLQRNSSAAACSDRASLAAAYFPQLQQSPMTLYIPWSPCALTGSSSRGFNVEYRPARRTIGIHCFIASPWIFFNERGNGVVALPQLALLLVPTLSIPAGQIDIVQDNWTEHLLHDDGYEVRLGTAGIS